MLTAYITVKAVKCKMQAITVVNSTEGQILFLPGPTIPSPPIFPATIFTVSSVYNFTLLETLTTCNFSLSLLGNKAKIKGKYILRSKHSNSKPRDSTSSLSWTHFLAVIRLDLYSPLYFVLVKLINNT